MQGTHVVTVAMNVRVVDRDADQINRFRQLLHATLEAGREAFDGVLVEDPFVTVSELDD